MEITESIHCADGRYPGSYVYAFLCEHEGRAIIKIGISDTPSRRLATIRSGCPFRHLNSVTINVYTRKAALEIESALLTEFKKWKTHGEWLSFSMEEKPVFNTKLREVLERFKKPGWPLKVVSSIEPRRQKREIEKRELEALRIIHEARTHSEAVERIQSFFKRLRESCKQTPIVD
jgi:hypothetical protein